MKLALSTSPLDFSAAFEPTVNTSPESRAKNDIMGAMLDIAFAWLIPLVVNFHLHLARYTKVEESFNIQAIHDIAVHGIPKQDYASFFSSSYDHFTFPGPVPRTFVGAVIMAGLSKPIEILYKWEWPQSVDKFYLQITARAILALLNSVSLNHARIAVDSAYGKVAGRWYTLLQVSQFHVMFYASRTLPNMFAFSMTTYALCNLVAAQAVGVKSPKTSKRTRLALYLLTFAGIVFRSEIAILLASQTMYLLWQGRASLVRDVIPAGVFGVVIGLATTVSVDSFFWQRFPLWPEWIGFVYNTVQGKSADWGVSPWHFYFFNAIPRLLMNPMSWSICIPLALLNRATRKTSLDILVPIVAFVAIYSVLPHKEWRFIIYIIPSLTSVASAGAAWIWTRRSKTLVYRLLSFGLVASTLASFAGSMGLLYISSLNYPGGEAITRLYNLVPQSDGPNVVFMDNLACQTGVTRFTERERETRFTYIKSEDQEKLLDPGFWHEFDYVLAESPERIIGSWEVVDTVYGYAGLGLGILSPEQESVPLPLKGPFVKPMGAYNRAARSISQRFTKGRWPVVRMEPKIHILKKQV